MYASNVLCNSKDGVRAGIETKRVHCTQLHGFACQPLRGLITSRQRRIINYLQTDRQTSLAAVSPSVYDEMMAELKELDKNLLAEMRKEIV